jgi:hypothetical protein
MDETQCTFATLHPSRLFTTFYATYYIGIHMFILGNLIYLTYIIKLPTYLYKYIYSKYISGLS